MLHQPTPPGSSRWGLLMPVEASRWSVSLCVHHGETPPGDIDGFMAFAKSFRMPTIYNAIRSAKRVGDIARFGIPCSVRRAFEMHGGQCPGAPSRRLSAPCGLWLPNRESRRRYRPRRQSSAATGRTSCRRPSAPAARPWWASPDGKEAVGPSACLVPRPSRSGSIEDLLVAACLASGGDLSVGVRHSLKGWWRTEISRALIDSRIGRGFCVITG